MPKKLSHMEVNMPASEMPTIHKMKKQELDEENPLQALHKSISAIDEDIEKSRKKVKSAKKLNNKKHQVDWQELDEDSDKKLAEEIEEEEDNGEEIDEDVSNHEAE